MTVCQFKDNSILSWETDVDIQEGKYTLFSALIYSGQRVPGFD
jgi:hypothetical protein